jgi:hypothetical protein
MANPTSRSQNSKKYKWERMKKTDPITGAITLPVEASTFQTRAHRNKPTGSNSLGKPTPENIVGRPISLDSMRQPCSHEVIYIASI